MPAHESVVEITTNIGCPVNCIKYCPQELITKHYVGDRTLSLEKFEEFISAIPKDQCLSFCGFSEPFVNQETIDMVEYASSRGHPIEICTTLVGMNVEQANRLCRVKIDHFLLHLPDASHNASIPNHSKQYIEVRTIIEDGIQNMRTINMGGLFVSNRCEDIARGKDVPYYKGKRHCSFMDNINYVITPNGNVYFCCITRGLSGCVGNLNAEPFASIASRHNQNAKILSEDSKSICHTCMASQNYYIYRLKQYKDRILGMEFLK